MKFGHILSSLLKSPAISQLGGGILKKKLMERGTPLTILVHRD